MEHPKKQGVRVLRARVAAIVLTVMALSIVAGTYSYHRFSSVPSIKRQAEEVAALERHVLPLVRELRASWYLNESFGTKSITWKRGKFTRDPERARQEGEAVFDQETEAAFKRLSQAIRTSGVPSNRLREAVFAADGTLRTASFQRHGGGLELDLNYLYSRGGKPAAWTSSLGPVVLTRIGDSDWWFEQSPDD